MSNDVLRKQTAKLTFELKETRHELLSEVQHLPSVRTLRKILLRCYGSFQTETVGLLHGSTLTLEDLDGTIMRYGILLKACGSDGDLEDTAHRKRVAFELEVAERGSVQEVDLTTVERELRFGTAVDVTE